MDMLSSHNSLILDQNEPLRSLNLGAQTRDMFSGISRKTHFLDQNGLRQTMISRLRGRHTKANRLNINSQQQQLWHVTYAARNPSCNHTSLFAHSGSEAWANAGHLCSRSLLPSSFGESLMTSALLSSRISYLTRWVNFITWHFIQKFQVPLVSQSYV